MQKFEFKFLFLSFIFVLLGNWPRFELWRSRGEDFLSPVRYGSYRVGKSISDAVSFWFTVGDLAEENVQLRKQVRNLEALQAEIELLRLENEQLREQVDLEKRSGGELVAAEVSGWEPFSDRKLLVINEGKQAGIKVGMPVLVGNALLGKVVSVTEQLAKVQLIFDGSLRIYACSDSPDSNATGIVTGVDFGQLLMEKILPEERIGKGDRIVTSGEGGDFPPGLVLGFVERVENQETLLKQAVLKPAIDLSHLDGVFVLLI